MKLKYLSVLPHLPLTLLIWIIWRSPATNLIDGSHPQASHWRLLDEALIIIMLSLAVINLSTFEYI